MRIRFSMEAEAALRNVNAHRMGQARTVERLTSGERINHAGDDAAGLQISERFTSRIEGFNQAGKNIQDAISLVQVADGAQSTIDDHLQRMRSLAVQAANDTLTDADRGLIQKDITQHIAEINRIADTADFNGKKLFATPAGPATTNSFTFHVGAEKDETINVELSSVNSTSLGIKGVDVSTRASAESAFEPIDTAIDRLSGLRAGLGAVQNRLEQTFNSSRVAEENAAAARSGIRDANFAEEITNLSRSTVLVNAGISVTSQAHIISANVLNLLQ